jgi:glutathionyl-hydroquinone reductase
MLIDGRWSDTDQRRANAKGEFVRAQGWTFGEVAEPLPGGKKLHEVYTRSQPDFTGRVNVPVLWDLESDR